MTKVVEGVLTIIQGLKPADRKQVFKGLLSKGVLSEDERDVLIIQSRRNGPTRPLTEFAREMKRKGRRG